VLKRVIIIKLSYSYLESAILALILLFIVSFLNIRDNEMLMRSFLSIKEESVINRNLVRIL
jgi:hypothetical protein